MTSIIFVLWHIVKYQESILPPHFRRSCDPVRNVENPLLIFDAKLVYWYSKYSGVVFYWNWYCMVEVTITREEESLLPKIVCLKKIKIKHFHLQVCSNEGFNPSPRGDNHEIPKIHWRNFKNLLQNHWANFNQTWHKTSLDVGDLSFFINTCKRPCDSLQKGENGVFSLNQWYGIIIASFCKFDYWLELFLGWAMWPIGLLFMLVYFVWNLNLPYLALWP